MDIKTTISISEARKKIFQIVDEIQKTGRYYLLTEKGKPKAVVLSAEEFSSIQETMEILSNPGVLRDIQKAEKEFAKGEYRRWEDVKKELGLPFGELQDFVVREKEKKKYRGVRKKK